MLKYYFVPGLLIALLLAGCKRNEPSRVEVDGEAQGTYFHIVYYDDQERDLRSGIDSLLTVIDMSVSAWVEQSVLSRINHGIDNVLVDDIYEGNFNLAQRISEETGGAFDVTVAPLVNAWGFGSQEGIDIDQHIIDSLEEFTGYKKVRIENGYVIKDDPRIQIDFNAIAQGYSVDLMASYLESNGIMDYLVDIGGEVICKGTKPKNQLWTIDIEKPQDNPTAERKSIITLSLQNRAIATSGNYRKFYIKDGMKYSHTINPATGYPVRHNLLSASVMAANCAEADAYATALMVMGLEGSEKFLDNHPELEAYLIYSDKDGTMQTWMTQGFSQFILK